MQAMGDMVLALERNGHTYRRDGSVYFRIASLPSYGQLARLDHDGMKPASASTSTNTRRTTPAISCCGRPASPGSRRGTTAPDPAGRAGTSSARRWRCACSKARIDICTPAASISSFPHHENEIAQAEGATGQPFSRFWVHVEHLFVEDEKMSKSIGNVYTVPDIVAQGASRRRRCGICCCRPTTASSSTSPGPGMDQAEESLRRIVDFLARLEAATGRGRECRA